jgi:23S rRNA (cytosine1962-C5)-methyltransferase
VPDYELIDVGGGARLERFGVHVTDRPYPAATGDRARPERWNEADLRFDRDRGWTGPAAPASPWPVEVGGVTLELRTTDSGQVGLFPEHLATLDWLRGCINRRTGLGRAPTVLHLFAYTGLATLAVAQAGARVAHVDGARSAVAWARHNAGLSGLADRPIRWLVDDALAFSAREIRRGRRYDGIVLDPPSYGHAGGRRWQLAEHLPTLLVTCASLVPSDGFVLLTAHTEGLAPDDLAGALHEALPGAVTGRVEAGELAIETSDGRRIGFGAFARWDGGA